MSLLNTRNIRVIIAAFALFTVVGYFVVSAGHYSESAGRVKPAASSDLIEAGNTLQGTAHKGVEAPYKTKPEVQGNQAAKLEPGKGQAENKPAAPVQAPEVEQKRPESSEKVSSGASCKQTDYVVMIDAGSTGSRVHVYSFDTCVTPPKLLNEEFKMLNPGLSSFDTDTKGAAASLDPLLEVALQTVPKDKQSCTPVAVKATAGLRMLGEEKSQAILKEVRNHLVSKYPFAVVEGDGISIMDGKDEGVYAWVTANYLLGNIGSSEKIPTAAVFDLGGGSTQIVFEPDFSDKNEQLVEGEHKYDFTFGDRKFTLYQFSHLGYGLMAGRNKVNAAVLKGSKEPSLTKYSSKAEAEAAEAASTIMNPCVAPGMTAKGVVVESAKDEFYKVNFIGPSEGLGAQCRFLAEEVLNMDTECKQQPCSFNGVYQPSLVKTFHKNSDMFVFSFFYDRTNPLGFPSSFTMEELRDLTSAVCKGLESWKSTFLSDALQELNKEPQWCLDLSFITAMLHTGYNIPLNRELRTAQKIANNELGWCLGASLPLLDSKTGNWKCRIQETTQ
uniref:guanosine-diphosphatase n=1 Tax=Candidozyma auris TaxID=498019 RepID=A0A0L0P9A6_CANAR